MPCPDCHRDHKRSKDGPCAACYRRKYYKTPGGKAAVDKANTRYVKAHPEVRTKHVVKYFSRTGVYTPLEVHLLRNAVKRLETAISATANHTGVHEPGQFRSQQSLERRNRFERGQNLLESGASHLADGFSRSSQSAHCEGIA